MSLGDIMPVGLLDRASGDPERLMHAARCIRALRMCGCIVVLTYFAHTQVRKLLVSFILKDQGFAAITYDNPIPRTDFQFTHGSPMLWSNFARLAAVHGSFDD